MVLACNLGSTSQKNVCKTDLKCEEGSAVWNSVLSRVTEMAFLEALVEALSPSGQGHWYGCWSLFSMEVIVVFARASKPGLCLFQCL